MFNCLAIDIGAGSGRIMRCTITNDEKIDLTEIARFPNESRMVDGRLRWDIDKLVADIKAGLAKAAAEMKPDAVAVDTWGVDYLLLDKNGKKIADPVCYRDLKLVGKANEFNSKFGLDRIRKLTGIQVMDFNTVYQLYVQSQEDPDYAEKAEHLLFVPDYIAYSLTGKIASSCSTAAPI